MKKIWLLVLAVSLLVGCAFFKQVASDYQLGKSTPLEQGEESPKEKAQSWASIISGIPYVGMAAPVVAFLGTFGFTWYRGSKKRKQDQAISVNPITRTAGKAMGAEAVVQTVADVRAGLLDVGDPESGTRRTWKGLILGAGAVGLTALIHSISGSHIPEGVNPALWSVLLAGLLGLEKLLQKVLPLQNGV